MENKIIVINQLKKFTKEILKKYPQIKIGYDYNELEKEYEVWYYGFSNFEYKFETLLGKKLYELFHKKGIYNVYFNPLNYKKYKNKINNILKNLNIPKNEYLMLRIEDGYHNNQLFENSNKILNKNIKIKKLKNQKNIKFNNDVTSNEHVNFDTEIFETVA